MNFPKPEPRPKLPPGQHRRDYLNRQGKIARRNEQFRLEMLQAWFKAEVDKGQRPTVIVSTPDYTSVKVQVERKHMPGENHSGWIVERVVRTLSRVLISYKGDGIVVGHKPSHQKARRPDERWTPGVVEPQSPDYNAWLSQIAQEKTQEGRAGR